MSKTSKISVVVFTMLAYLWIFCWFMQFIPFGADAPWWTPAALMTLVAGWAAIPSYGVFWIEN